MKPTEVTFKEQVYELVSQIPKGRVMTYGQIATLCGQPRSARIVGYVANGSKLEHHHKHTERSGLDGVQGDNENRASGMDNTASETRKVSTQRSAKNDSRVTSSASQQTVVTCPLCDLPWHRVVKKDGSLAEGYPGGTENHKSALEAEDIKIIDYRVQGMEKLLWHPK